MDNSGYKILIVDDVPDNITIVKNILQNAGYTTTTAEDGLTTLELVKNNHFDLILLDIMMPNMSGIEVCQHLKQDPITFSIPIIFLTANSDRDTLIKAYEVGGSDYLKKPFFKEELLARVSSRLKIRYYEKNLENQVEQKTKDNTQTQLELMYVLGSLTDGHSPNSYAHVKRVSEFSYTLAKLSGMKEDEALILKNVSALHDIGKLDMAKEILNKEGSLDKKEQFEMSKHTTAGADMLRNCKLPIFNAAIIVAEQHHEKYDGKGYPDRLKGENIHIYARIVTIADVYDELTEKAAWSQEEILVYMKDMKGKYFDPILIDLLFDNLDDFLKIYKIKVNKEVLEEKLSKKKSGFMGWFK